MAASIFAELFGPCSRVYGLGLTGFSEFNGVLEVEALV